MHIGKSFIFFKRIKIFWRVGVFCVIRLGSRECLDQPSTLNIYVQYDKYMEIYGNVQCMVNSICNIDQIIGD